MNETRIRKPRWRIVVDGMYHVRIGAYDLMAGCVEGKALWVIRDDSGKRIAHGESTDVESARTTARQAASKLP